ncbi:flavodoxin family protein [Aquihabitans sp. G128]|uniref:flavodoxin family protein n=1 Tax=Aquihabitans sp. G128 TaxID=2849779 RepID=UPI00352F5465
MANLRSVTLNCTLKPSPATSSTDLLAGLVNDELEKLGVATEVIRVVDHDVKPGVTSDEGDGDAWPGIRQKILDSQILLLATPIWLGNPSSVSRRVLERLDAFLGEEDDQGRVISYDRVAIAATVGNEDGAHMVAGQFFQGLADVGFTIPPNAQAYWVGEAMGSTDLNDLDEVPEKVRSTAADVAKNAVHLATLLQQSPYPA